MSLKIKFEAQINKIVVKKCITQDKEGMLWLEFLPTDDLVDKLNRLMRVDETVKVRIER